MTDELEQLHNLELLLASEVLKICEKYNLKIVMLAGTFLGAIRHNGFIPWDDDMDFGMPREDFERFKEVRADDFYQFPCALRAVGALHGHRDTGPGKAGAGGQYPGHFDPGECLQSPGDFGLQQPGAGVKRAEKPPLRADHFPAGK